MTEPLSPLDLDRVDAVIGEVKNRWDHAGVLALIRAAEKLRAQFAPTLDGYPVNPGVVDAITNDFQWRCWQPGRGTVPLLEQLARRAHRIWFGQDIADANLSNRELNTVGWAVSRYGTLGARELTALLAAGAPFPAEINAPVAAMLREFLDRRAQPDREPLWFVGEGRAVDVAVLHRGDILMIARRDGGGWALPGGFVEDGEDEIAAMLRELAEETGLDAPTLPAPTLVGARFRTDDPRNTDAAWITTRVGLIRVPATAPRPPTVAGDDAADARWVPYDAPVAMDRFLHRATGSGLYPGHGRLLRLVLDTVRPVETGRVAAVEFPTW